MSSSRQFDRFQARLQQKGKEKIRAFGTFANENNECILESYEVPGPKIAGLKKCVPVPEASNYTLFSQLDWTPFAPAGCRGTCQIHQKVRDG